MILFNGHVPVVKPVFRIGRRLCKRLILPPGRALLFLAVSLFLIPAMAPVHPARAETLRKATFMPQWFPQAQFAGYYVAREKGFYRKFGVDLTILRGGPESPAVESIVKRRADFTTLFLSEGIRKRSEGVKLVNVGQIVQRSGFILVARKSSGINVPADLAGKKVSLWPDFSVQPLAFFRKYGLQVKTVPQTYTPNLFLRGGVDVTSAMWYNEYHTLINAGLNEDEMTAFFFDQHGLNFPEDGIYCLEETCRNRSDLCISFVRASLAGWLYAFEHPEEALDILMKYVNEAKINTSRNHQRWMLNRMKDIIIPGGDQAALGRLRQEDYLRVAGEIHDAGLIKRMPSYGDFYVPIAGTR